MKARPLQLEPVLKNIGALLQQENLNERLQALDASLRSAGYSDVAQLRNDIVSREHQELARRIYNGIAAQMDGEPWFIFMNHGYAPTAEEAQEFPKLSVEDDKWRHQVYLYFCLLAGAEPHLSKQFSDCRLLDVGCGRGGGLSAVKRYFSLAKGFGLDLNAQQISFCRNRHSGLDLEFSEGTALALPFDDEEFDLVCNVESSHCYVDMQRSIGEIARVLKPMGLLLFTDVRDAIYGVPLLELEFLASGLELLSKRDITAGVKEACEQDKERFRHVFNSSKAEFPRSIAEQHAQMYASGQVRYMVYVLRKPHPGALGDGAR